MIRLIFYQICYLLSMKEDNLFVLFVCCIEIFSNHVFYHTFDIIGRLSMSKDALS